MNVVVYEPTYNDKLRNVLRAFAEGVPGAVCKPCQKFVPGEADVAVVFGWFKYAYPPTMAKKPIIEYPGHKLIVVESAFQLRGDYYQVGWNGFAGHADFRNDGVSNDRWQSFGIKSKPWQKRPNGPVVVIGQLPRDTQVQDVDHLEWCRDAVRYYRKKGEKVLFRPHPKAESARDYGVKDVPHDTGLLKHTLAKAKAVVTWNSTTGVDAGIRGVPVVACDKGSMAWEIASHAFHEPLRYPSRKQWLAGIGYAQWTPDEMRAGLPWLHLTR